MLQITNGTAVLSEEAALQIVEFERMAKEIKQKEDSLKAMILQEMEANGVLSIKTPELTISYIAPTQREVFDTKTFRADFEELYDQYVTITPVKSSIRIKVK